MDNEKLMKIFGATEIVDAFNNIQFEVQNKIIRTSFKKAAKLIITQAQANLGGTYSHVSQSLSESFRKDIQTTNVGAAKKKGGYLAHIANAGTKERYTKAGKSTGFIKPNYFWDLALTSTEGQVEEIIYKDIKDQFMKMLQKNKTK